VGSALNVMAGLGLVVVFLIASSADAASPFLSPARGQPASTGVTDFTGVGRKLAEDLQKLLPRKAGASALLEPGIDQPREDEKEKETRGELLAAASTFNAADSGASAEQQAVEDALREAMVSSSSQLGVMDRHIENSLELTCLPDFSKCPDGWLSQGVLCSAGSDYKGECAPEVDLSEMNIEQKVAFAAACSVKFPCQGSCDGGQDFRQTCPSLWREIAAGVCQAPLEYVGSCSARVNTATMTAEEKYTWSVRCAARWPCAASKRHNYRDICPKGWSLSTGQVCTAPETYKGPCEHTAYMSSATNTDKKAFEASCQVEWAPIDGSCVHDYTATCPYGWHTEEFGGCVAPATYDSCSPQKSFAQMTPAQKEDWAKMCRVEFPCRDRSSCEKSYGSSCPADWYAFNGGMSCTAPSQYGGPCASVLHGLAHLTKSEKQTLEGQCGFAWPCDSEDRGSDSGADSGLIAEPRLTANLSGL